MVKRNSIIEPHLKSISAFDADVPTPAMRPALVNSANVDFTDRSGDYESLV